MLIILLFKKVAKLDIFCVQVFMGGEGRPRQDLEYKVYLANELAD